MEGQAVGANHKSYGSETDEDIGDLGWFDDPKRRILGNSGDLGKVALGGEGAVWM